MKTQDIIKCLDAEKQISGYELTIINKDSRELFYVLKHLEINRAVNTKIQQIRVYVDSDDKKGDSIITVIEADDEKSLKSKIKAAVIKAKTATNKYYPLIQKTKNIVGNDIKSGNLNDVANQIAEAVLKANVYDKGWINSTEIFVTKTKKQLITSSGINHIDYGFKVEIEVIPTWSNGKEEFELYKFYEAGEVKSKEITKEVDDILQLAKARSEAKTIKDVNISKNVKVLVKNDMLEEIVGNLTEDLSYAKAYRKENHYKKDDIVSNNQFDLTMKPFIKGCIDSSSFDNHGVVLKNQKIITNGKVANLWGDIRYGYYLGQKKITGTIPCVELDGKPSDYEKDEHIIIENFSAPQLEDMSGYWGGEVRLARYFDGEKYIPLTSFSISGNIYDDLKNVEFSKEITITHNYKGPKYFIFKGISIH